MRYQALEKALPERVQADISVPIPASAFSGRRPDRQLFLHPRQRPWWLGRLRNARRRRPVSAPCACDTASFRSNCRRAYLPVRIEELALRRIPAVPGKFRGGLGFSQELPGFAPCELADQPRPHALSAPGGSAGRPRRAARRFTVINGETGAVRSIEKEKGFRVDGGRPHLHARPVAAAATGRRRRTLELIQRDLDAGLLAEAGCALYVSVGADER